MKNKLNKEEEKKIEKKKKNENISNKVKLNLNDIDWILDKGWMRTKK